MSLAAGAAPAPPGSTPARAGRVPPLGSVHSRAERLRLFTLWFMMVGGAFVFAEPSPYEIAALTTLAVFALTGAFVLRAGQLPLIFLLLIYCFALTAGAIPVLTASKVATWVAVSWYLATTTIFFSTILADNTERRLDALIRGWTLAALIAAGAGLVGYFRAFPGAFDLFTLYGRAKGTFNDPNVFGPFLILPMLVAVQTLLTGRGAAPLKAAAILAVLLAALLLSFSRGAWVHFAMSAAIMAALMFLTARTVGERAKIVLAAIAGLVALAAFLGLLMSIDKVAALMEERFSLNQSYDSGPMGRFGRHAYGWQLALERPLGIGPLQFHRFFPEDPHNVYLNAFMAGGWGAGVAYGALVALTLAVGLASSFRHTPWRRVSIAVFACFAGLAFEGKIIDTDHWRHFWVLAGLIWGLAIADQRFGPRSISPLATPGKTA